jgi:signal transduction histidine kinase
VALELSVGTLAYGIAAGTSFGIAVVFLIIAQHRRWRDPVLLAFGAAGLANGVNAIATVRLQSSTDVDEYADLLQVYGMINLLVVITFVTLVATLSRSTPRPLRRVFFASAAVIAILQAVLPDGLLAADITALRAVTLFGERFVVHEGGSSPWRPVLDLFLVLTLVLVMVTLWRSFRSVERSLAAIVTACVTISLAFGLYDSFVDEGVATTPYLAPFGDVVIAIVAGAYLARQMVGTERRLQEQTVELEATVAERTAALVEANRRLEESLSRQRRSTAQLTSLAGHFEDVNALTLTEVEPPTIAASLRQVITNLGRLVGASSVTLRLDRTTDADVLGEEIRWTDGSPPSEDPLGTRLTAPLEMQGTALGELVIESVGTGLGQEQRRYVDLTVTHLAGFVDRLALVRTIATSAVQSERERIAQELHDSVTQKLYSASFLAEATSDQLAGEHPNAERTAGRLRQILLAALAELRTLMFELHPSALESTRLAALLQQLCDTFDASSPLTVDAAIADGGPLPMNVRVGLYRIAQEALSNAARHSDADAAEVELERIGDTVRLSVADDGCGFDAREESSGYGLGNMRKRAETIDAELTVRSSPGGGTSIVATWSPSTSASSDPDVASDTLTERAAT